MRDVLVALFWIWLLAALCVYAYRIYRRITRGPKPPADDTLVAGPATPPPAPTWAPTSAPAPPSHPTPEPPPAVDTPSPPPTDGDRGRQGLFAPRPPAPPRGPARPTVADAVAGIALPCDLAPLVGDETRIDPFRVVFFTDRADAATVGASLGDELERLGYTLHSTSETEVVATRPDASLQVSIPTDASSYPTAPAGSVLVVLST